MSSSGDRRKHANQLLKELSGAADSIDAYLKTARKPARDQAQPTQPIEEASSATLDAPLITEDAVAPEAGVDSQAPLVEGAYQEEAAAAIEDLVEPAPVALVEIDPSEFESPAFQMHDQPTPAASLSPVADEVPPASLDARFPPMPPIVSSSSIEPEPTASVVLPENEAETGPVDEIQETILPIVAEELDEIVPEIETLLRRLVQGDRDALPDLHRHVHTMKGSLGMVGAMRLRTVAHSMETWLEEAVAGKRGTEGLDRVLSLFEGLKERLDILFGRAQDTAAEPSASASVASPASRSVPAQRMVRVPPQEIDRLVAENNEARLAGSGIAASATRLRAMLAELQENGQRLARVQRDLEIQAESQIQSRRAQLQEAGQEFDPLEMDRFTRLQETSRFLAESVSDASDIYRELARQVANVEALQSEQEGAIQEVGTSLARTRLVPVDAINDRLYQVVWQSARELGKLVEFRLEAAANQGLDRVLLDRLVAPLEHILRNAVAHGIEEPAVRRKSRKPETGTVVVSFRQEAGRLVVEVADDGAGLNPDRIRAKAIERGLWAADRSMDEQAAADMICTPGFSTADSISQLSGRGVGMDVVRSEVLGMGGRFAIANHNGLRVSMFLPLTVASVSATAVEAGGEAFALPVETVEHTTRLAGVELEQARQTGQVEVEVLGQSVVMPYSDLAPWLGLDNPRPPQSITVMVLREGDRRVALGADRLLGISDLPLRPLGPWWSGVPGIMGSVLLANGRAAFLVDPLRMRNLATGPAAVLAVAKEPVVMVVDDSITVRKVAARFLERHGFRPVLARDGREALELMVDMVPDAILMDVEMPRMDGFDCARNIRENPKLAGIPIAMITSRTAEKHRRRAQELGVEAYFGKPFREEDVLAWLSGHLGSTP